MIIKDWIAEAARDIYAGEDSSEGTIADVIHRHSPFKDGVAYMPMPRCEGCRHFLPHDRPGAKLQTGTTKGDCLKLHLNGIDKSFGCLKREAK